MSLTQAEIDRELQELGQLPSLTLKHLKLSFLIGKLLKEEGYDIVVYGGAAVEQYTQGGYTTGDLDIGYLDSEKPPPEIEEKVFQKLGTPFRGRVRLIEEIAVDIGGRAEILAKEPLFKIRETEEENSFILHLERPEEALLSRILQGTYPTRLEDQIKAAKMIIAQALAGNIPFDWEEMERLCTIPGCNVSDELKTLVQEVTEINS